MECKLNYHPSFGPGLRGVTLREGEDEPIRAGGRIGPPAEGLPASELMKQGMPGMHGPPDGKSGIRRAPT